MIFFVLFYKFFIFSLALNTPEADGHVGRGGGTCFKHLMKSHKVGCFVEANFMQVSNRCRCFSENHRFKSAGELAPTTAVWVIYACINSKK